MRGGVGVGGVLLNCSGLLRSLPVPELRLPYSATDYSCALQRDILLQGRLYLSENWICFYSNIFRWETLVKTGASLVIQWLGLQASIAGVHGFDP